MIYFDNAATTHKKPVNVLAAVNNAIKNYSFNPGRGGYVQSLKTAEAIFTVRQKVAEFFGAGGPQNVIFTQNCTAALNYVIKGVLKYGDEVIVSSLEHNAVMRPLVKTKNPYSTFAVSLTDNAATLENFESAITPATRLVICTAASNVCGKILPIEEIGEICKSRGILFAVDAAQLAGVIPINMQKMHIDYLCIAPHKGLYAPEGTGILIADKEIRETIIEGGTGTNSLEMIQPPEIPEKFESGTLNVPGILGIGAGIDFLQKNGIKKLYSHEMRLIGLLYDGLKKNSSVRLYTPYPKPFEYVPVIPFNIEGAKSESVASVLAESSVATRGGYHCAPSAHRQIKTTETGAVRISLSAFNTEEECRRFLNIASGKNFYEKIKKIVD